MLGQLGLYDNALTGGIPNELYGATRLNYINLQNNRLEGRLSISIEKLTILEKLVLFNNYFTGNLPFHQFGGTRLKFLGVTNNVFSGTLPDSLSMMSHLEYMYLDGNNFGGIFPQTLGRMTNLSEFHNRVVCQSIGKNHFSPSRCFHAESINCNENGFTGTLPSDLGNLHFLEYLSIQNNALTGQIPVEIGQLTNLRKCSMHFFF